MNLALPYNPVQTSNRSVVVSFARGLAILTIVFYHIVQKVSLPPLVFKAILLGGSGIYVYLFLSGYGLALSTQTNWQVFWEKRFFKVILPYYIAVTLIFSVNLLVPLYKTEGWPEYLSHLLLYKMVINRYTRNLGEHLWFVSTIIQFYLVMPLLSGWQNRARPVVFVSSAILISLVYSIAITMFDVAHLRIWYSSFVQYLGVYCLGMALARNGRLSEWVSRPWYVYVATGSICLLLVLLMDRYFGQAGGVFNDYFVFAAYSSLVVLMYKLSSTFRWLRQFVLWVEPFSYSLYLTHMLIFSLYRYATAYRPIDLPDVLLIVMLAIGSALLFQQVINWLIPRLLPQA